MVKFKSNNGGEYISCAFKEYLAKSNMKQVFLTALSKPTKQNETTKLS
jgi:hypothetical protein